MKKNRNYQVAFYVMLNILISWTGVYLTIGLDGMLGKRAISDMEMPMLMGAMIMGPLVATICSVVLFEGRRGFIDLKRKLIQIKVSKKYYAIGIFAAPICFILTIMILMNLSEEFLPLFIGETDKVSVIVGGIIGGLVAGFFEELGWTYFVTPRLREQYSLLKASLVLGVIWGFWHAPLFMSPDPMGKIPLIIVIGARLFTQLPVYRIMMIWIYDKSGSLFLSILTHMSLTASTLIFMTSITSGIFAIVFNLIWTLIFSILLWIIIGRERLNTAMN